mmetsp:Transcript_32468/g.98129  ORF Transcript_32468/g.98129 Transcript_32468/m.98129 type:complete len:387 (-) Transcript_32468:128-1288(-)
MLLRPILALAGRLRRFLGHPRPRGILQIAKLGCPPQADGVATTFLVEREHQIAADLLKGDLGAPVEIETAQRQRRPQSADDGLRLVVEPHGPPPQVGLVVRRGVSKGVEGPDVEVPQSLGADLDRRGGQLQDLRQVLHRRSRSHRLDRHVRRPAGGHHAARQQVRRHELRQDHNLLGRGGDVLRKRLPDGVLLVEALRHGGDRQGQAVVLQNLPRQVRQPRGHVEQNALALLAAGHLHRREDGAEAQDHDERSGGQGGDGVPIKALTSGVHQAVMERLPQGLRELVRVAGSLLLGRVRVEELADRQEAVRAAAPAGVPDEVVGDRRLAARLLARGEVLGTDIFHRSSLGRRGGGAGGALILVVGVDEPAPLRVVQLRRLGAPVSRL